MTPAQRFLAARDFLLRHRTDYDTAYRKFAWPALDRFNWAIDYFDAMARGNDKPALILVEASSGTQTTLSFAQTANPTRANGGCRHGTQVRHRGGRDLRHDF